MFNKFFIESGGELCNDIPSSVTIPEDHFADFECPANALLYVKEISEKSQDCLTQSIASKTSRMDQISAKILKIVSHVFVCPHINFQPINPYTYISN